MTGSNEGIVRIWNRESGIWEDQVLTRLLGRVTCIAIDPSRQFIVIGGMEKDGAADIWSQNKNGQWKLVNSLIGGHKSFVNSVAIDSNRQFVVAGSTTGFVRIFPLSLKEMIRRAVHYSAHHSALKRSGFEPRDSLLARGCFQRIFNYLPPSDAANLSLLNKRFAQNSIIFKMRPGSVFPTQTY